MPESLDRLGALTLFVADPAASKAFYERTFELPVLFEDETSVAFKFKGVVVNLVQRAGAAELIEPVAVAPGDAGSSWMLTVWVDSADGACAQLRDRGVELLNGPMDRPWGVRTAAFADPDGHVWEVAQQLGG
jgi:catechol 2,3-dioxygenase-like lactoylglutathione lyase family enzyme